MGHYELNYLEIFHQNGYRLTRQREIILDAVCKAEGHASLAEIYLITQTMDKKIDRSTLYRALDAFVKMGIVNCAEDRHGQKVFEMVSLEPHHHLVCKNCGKQIEIENEIVNDFYKYLQMEYQYQIEMDHLCLFGTCSNCKT